ncbi:5'-nucleotidase domain-containing protein [Sodiomyces alkalinus F11]|uniref:5'-nucleotidase domain-containing protein n=1 Tax=Sodiomyces alkalinus (strain CBS 110278 / VKM F-3762 / F11) TaxID=1314773 RepID=A0A3N2PMK9_SODAK|nr:5'-nucleotidase domain-containing protein [Sodiomyces alkalinus F11]ROT35566.1 5'-nucleotidase domain-containing protein [Sodiomyces alkalinus F11]
MRTSLASSALALALAGVVSAVPQKVDEDHLYSSRLAKRGLDADGNFNVSFFHINDVHAHLDEFSSSGADCTNPSRGCYGGYARVKHTVDELRPLYEDSLWLNAGDEFQGTLFYTYYRGEKIAETINQLGFDAMTLGNHEFDGGDDELGEFLLNLTFPVISANIQSNHTALNQTIIPYKIFEDQGVAIIGATTPTTRNIANPGPGTRFLDVVDSVQACIDEIRATTDIKRIVALTHIGYAEDQALAAATSGLSLVMGGHSHTPLGDLHPNPQGDYPTVVQGRDGHDVFVVQAWRWGEYVGYIDVSFDADGHPVSYHGGPIHLDNTTAQDAALQAQIDEWRGPFEEFAGVVVGYTNVDLVQATCQTEECTLGNVMADAMYEYRLETSEDRPPDFALINAGGIRAAIEAGNVTRGQVLTSFPFGNAITELTFSGADVRRLLEGCVSRVNQFNGEPITSGFQVSASVRLRYNPALDPGERIVSLLIDGEEVVDDEDYIVVTLDFLAGGGDNMFELTTDYVPLDLQDEVLIRYLGNNSPIDAEIEGRFEATDELPGPEPTSSAAPPTSTRTCIPRPRVTGL